ncbi:hypothetical protein F4561_003056 [Lipingzhangella halophila]|uniref:Uncharacterized protein n=1 Tax=Lipingzhangella halophila TaxID=1783352 RepID=A0A7W7W2Z3_9ACTN|nr:hypothetical protein [Lipingzhangella halophila]
MSMVFGAIIALSGVLVGRTMTKRQQTQSQHAAQQAVTAGNRNPQPICGCGHHLVFHDQESKRCQAQVVIPGRWTGQHSSTYRTCMCQGYRGPMPVDEYYAPDLLNGDS